MRTHLIHNVCVFYLSFIPNPRISKNAQFSYTVSTLNIQCQDHDFEQYLKGFNHQLDIIDNRHRFDIDFIIISHWVMSAVL